jgi:actin-related protein
MHNERAVVIDSGTCYCKSGFAGDDSPKSIINSFIGYPICPTVMIGKFNKDSYVGHEAM